MAVEWCTLGLISFTLAWLVLDLRGIAGNMPYSPRVEKTRP